MSPGDERRQSDRRSCDVTVSCRQLTDRSDLFWPAVVQDVSDGGIGLVMRRPFAPGAVLTLRFTEREAGTNVIAEVQVIHAHPVREGRWTHGCTFLYRPKELRLPAGK